MKPVFPFLQEVQIKSQSTSGEIKIYAFQFAPGPNLVAGSAGSLVARALDFFFDLPSFLPSRSQPPGVLEEAITQVSINFGAPATDAGNKKVDDSATRMRDAGYTIGDKPARDTEIAQFFRSHQIDPMDRVQFALASIFSLFEDPEGLRGNIETCASAPHGSGDAAQKWTVNYMRAFMRAYHEINLHFAVSIKKLVTGSAAKLFLEQPGTPLEGGIGAEFRPPKWKIVRYPDLTPADQAAATLSLICALNAQCPRKPLVLYQTDLMLASEAATGRLLALLGENSKRNGNANQILFLMDTPWVGQWGDVGWSGNGEDCRKRLGLDYASITNYEN